MNDTIVDGVSMSPEPPSLLTRIFRWVGWGIFAAFCLVLFTLMKLPQAKLHNFITGTINQQLAPLGMELQADEGHVNVGIGIGYEMTGVRFVRTENSKTIKLVHVSVSPSILGLVSGRVITVFNIDEGQGSIKAKVAVSAADLLKSAVKDIELNVSTDGINLGRSGALPFLVGLEGTGDVKGEIDLAGDFNIPSSLIGTVRVNLSKLTLDQQPIMGFPSPRISVSEGVIDVAVSSGKATLKNVHLGKTGGSDDIVATADGDIKFSRRIDSSDLSLKVKLAVSQSLMKSFGFVLDGFLAASKISEGSYAFKVTGNTGQPGSVVAVPDR